MRDLVVRSARIAGAPQPVDIGIDAGVVVDVTPSGGAGQGRSRSVLDAGGRVVIPGLVESHLHLDKALLGVRAGGSTLQQAIAETARRKTTFTRDDIRERALQVLRWAVSSGTTAVRAHTEVDPGVGLLGIDTVGQIAEELAGAITL
jgi:cytosine deaminase